MTSVAAGGPDDRDRVERFKAMLCGSWCGDWCRVLCGPCVATPTLLSPRYGVAVVVAHWVLARPPDYGPAWRRHGSARLGAASSSGMNVGTGESIGARAGDRFEATAPRAATTGPRFVQCRTLIRPDATLERKSRVSRLPVDPASYDCIDSKDSTKLPQ